MVYRLPASWNGKVLGFGGGGWIGNVALQTASEGLRKGYATLQTDGGHPIGNVWDNSWAANPEQAKDFSYRAIHEMTVGGKKLVAAYYSQPHRRAYYQGCSTGGRMGLMEAQRFPEDYDLFLRLVAGADVVVVGFRPGVMEKLGLGYGTLAAAFAALLAQPLHAQRSDWDPQRAQVVATERWSVDDDKETVIELDRWQIEAADVVLMRSDPLDVPVALTIGRGTLRGTFGPLRRGTWPSFPCWAAAKARAAIGSSDPSGRRQSA